jgi:preprotein translocase subunit SecG
MLLVALILVAIALVCSLLLQINNIREVDDSREYKGIVIGKTGAVDILKEKVHVGHDDKPPLTTESS